MATFLWEENQSIPVYPWDTSTLLLARISEKEGTPVPYLRVEQDFYKLLQDIDWEDEVEVNLDVRNLEKEWAGTDMIMTLKTLVPEEKALYLRYKTRTGEVDEQLWDTLFRHEFQDLSFAEWQQTIRQQEQEEKQDAKAAHTLSKHYKEFAMEEQHPILGWKVETHRVQYQVEDPRTLPQLFADLKLTKEWRMALLHQKLFQWGEKDNWVVKMKRMKDPSLEGLLQDIQESVVPSSMEPGILLYHHHLETPVRIQPGLEIEMETSDEYPNLIGNVQDILEIPTIKKQVDVGMVGHFMFPQLYIDIPLFQDMCMNDPIISHFLYINELNKTQFDTQVGIHFQQPLKDVLQAETIKKYDFTLKNIHRQTGFQVVVSLETPLSQKHLPIFFIMLRQVIARYVRQRDRVLEEYAVFIPTIKTILEKAQRSLVKNIKSTRPEYISKYPRMFVRNLYSVICQKNLQPTLITEEDTHALPKESVLLFPPQPIAELQPEYYYCPNKDYPFAGLKEMDLKGKDVFINLVPCCFNSPQEKENERKLLKLRTKDDTVEEEKEKTVSKANIITGKFLIKYPGQLGTIRPPSMNRFFMAYDPFVEYFRIGTEQSTSSLIHCMLTRRNMMGVSTPYNAVEVREKISQDKDCVVACLQENPGLNLDEIRADIANPLVYFDPRRFYRAIELYFGVRLLVFSKEQDMAEEDAQLLYPFSMRTHYSNHSELPFTVIFEHWGGKTNILSKFQHPHCELVGYKPPTEPTMRFDFNPKGIFQLLENTVFPFDGNQAIQSFYRKECWFFRHIIGQTTDPLGKVRWLHFQYYNQDFYAEIYPPLAVQDDVEVGPLPKDIPIVSARLLVRFLQKFDHWEKLFLQDDLVYWKVSQDHVLWKSLEENSSLHFVFVCRLEKPPLAIPDDLRSYIRETPPPFMMFKPKDTVPFLHYSENIAHQLVQYGISSFSHFLQENKVRQDALDANTLIETFFQTRIKITPGHIYDQGTESYFSNGKLVLPSQRFWEKLLFQLKWLLFYQPQYIFSTKETTPNNLQQVHDFAQIDPDHYYCELGAAQNVLRYSVEDTYEVLSCPLEELPAAYKQHQDQYVLWYQQDLSPYPHPSLVFLYPTYTMTLLAIHHWRKDHRIMPAGMLMDMPDTEEEPNVYDWEPTLHRWLPSGNAGATITTEKMFRARIGQEEYLLFFPL